MLEIVKPNTNIDFLRMSGYAAVLSLVVIGAGLVSLVVKGGPRYGIDFSGGILVHVRVAPDVTVEEIRSALSDVGGVQVQAFESQRSEYLLRVQAADEELEGGTAARIKERLQETFGKRGFEHLRTEIVGPQVGAELRSRALWSVALATIAMGIYIWFRFDFRFGVGAGVALAHDVLVTIGALSIANFEFDLTIIAALLTIVGYSVNDTVVISDRIRENLSLTKRPDLPELINRSINETLSRTFLTTGATMLAVIALFLVGGSVIHGFAFSLMVGFIAGVYSTVFIATPVVALWDRYSARAG